MPLDELRDEHDERDDEDQRATGDPQRGGAQIACAQQRDALGDDLDHDAHAERELLHPDQHREAQQHAEGEPAPKIAAPEGMCPVGEERGAGEGIERVRVARHVGRVVGERRAEQHRHGRVRGRPRAADELRREPEPEEHGEASGERAREKHEALDPQGVAVERNVGAEQVDDSGARGGEPDQRRPDQRCADRMNDRLSAGRGARLVPRISEPREVVVEHPVAVKRGGARHEVEHVTVAAREDGAIAAVAARRGGVAAHVAVGAVHAEDERERGCEQQARPAARLGDQGPRPGPDPRPRPTR